MPEPEIIELHPTGNAQVDYLVAKKFPWAGWLYNEGCGFRGGKWATEEQYDNEASNIKAYQTELLEKSEQEINNLYEAEKQKEQTEAQCKESENRKISEIDTGPEDIPYFKFRHAFRPSWTLYSASCLLLGHDPDKRDFVSDINDTEIQALEQFLLCKHKEGKIHGIKSDREARYEPAQLYELMAAEQRSYDDAILDIIKLIRFNRKIWTEKARLENKIYRSLFRYAASVLWVRYPTLNKSDMAKLLEELPEHLRGKYPLEIRAPSGTIADHLKGLKDHEKGRPKKDLQKPDEIDWEYLIEYMNK